MAYCGETEWSMHAKETVQLFTCQSAQTSVPQTCVLLHLLQLLHVQAELQQEETSEPEELPPL